MVALVDFCLQWLGVVGPLGSCSSKLCVGFIWMGGLCTDCMQAQGTRDLNCLDECYYEVTK